MSQTLTPAQRLQKNFFFNKCSYSVDVSEIEADVIFALQRGKMPALVWDDPDYIETAIRDGSTLLEIQGERALYMEAWQQTIKDMKKLIKLDKKRRRKERKL